MTPLSPPAPPQALRGQGLDRHLLGLKLQAIEEGLSIPKVFMDTAYGLATHWRLRTGQVSPPQTPLRPSQAPICPDMRSRSRKRPQMDG